MCRCDGEAVHDGKAKNEKADWWSTEEEIDGGACLIRWGKSDKAERWLSDWRSNWRSDTSGSWEGSTPTRSWLVMLVRVDVSGAGKTRCGESPPRNSEYLPNLLKMVVDGLGVECAPNKAGISKNSFVVIEN